MTTRWVWRLVLLGGAAYLAVQVLALLWLVVVPVLTALLVTALLRPVTELLRRWVPGAPAALATLLVVVLAVGGLGYLVELRVIQQMDEIVADVQSTVEGLRSLLGRTGLSIDQVPFTRIEQTLTEWAQSHSNDLFGYLATGLGYVAELVTFVVLTLFVTFFLLKDGGRIWRFLTGLLPRTAAQRVDRAGRVAWETLTGYVHGTVVIAVIHTHRDRRRRLSPRGAAGGADRRHRVPGQLRADRRRARRLAASACWSPSARGAGWPR